MSRRLSAPFLVMCAVCFVRVSTARSDGAAGTTAPALRVESGDAGSAAHHHKLPERARGPIKVAITIDDMPGGGPELLGYTHVQMVKDMIAALRAHRVPHAAGFVVGSMLEARPDRYAALDAWLQAGFLVGNHTYSHNHIAELGSVGFMDDILKNRELVDTLEKRSGQERSYFRFPYLEEGKTREERRALWHLLQREHYTQARVSIAFGDTDWADAYLRCQEKGDKESLPALDRSYLSQALAYLHWAVEASDEVLGHPIPHVLLLHVNVPSAKNLEALLRSYEAHGVQFVALEEALRDPAYALYYDAPGGDLLSQASHSSGRAAPPKPPQLDFLIDRVCR